MRAMVRSDVHVRGLRHAGVSTLSGAWAVARSQFSIGPVSGRHGPGQGAARNAGPAPYLPVLTEVGNVKLDDDRAIQLILHDYTRTEAREEFAEVLRAARVSARGDRLILAVNKCDARTSLDSPLLEVMARISRDASTVLGETIGCIPISAITIGHSANLWGAASRMPEAMCETLAALDELLASGALWKLRAAGGSSDPRARSAERAVDLGRLARREAATLSLLAWRAGGGRMLSDAVRRAGSLGPQDR